MYQNRDRSKEHLLRRKSHIEAWLRLIEESEKRTSRPSIFLGSEERRERQLEEATILREMGLDDFDLLRGLGNRLRFLLELPRYDLGGLLEYLIEQSLI
jgi:hypothetical protein